MNSIDQLETELWAAADNLRANSKLTSSEYCMPALSVIFLRHATNRYDAAVRQIEADQTAGAMPKRPLVKGDFLERRALHLPPDARYDVAERSKMPRADKQAVAKRVYEHIWQQKRERRRNSRRVTRCVSTRGSAHAALPGVDCSE